MTRCKKCGSTILASDLQRCRCVGAGRPHSVSSFVRTHPRAQADQTHGRLHQLWRRHWSALGLPLVLIGWGGFWGLSHTSAGYGGIGLVRSPFFLMIAVAIGVGMEICKRDVKRGNRVRGTAGIVLGSALGAAAMILLYTRVLSPETLLKM